MPEETKDSVESTEKEFDSTERTDRSEGRDESRDISESISTEEPKDFSSNLDLSFIQKEVANREASFAKPTFEDFKQTIAEMPEDENLKKRREAQKFEEEMSKTLSDPNYRKAVKEQQEIEKSTPGTKEYKRAELDKTASEAAVASNASTMENVLPEVKAYLQSAGTQLFSGALGPIVGAAFSRIPGLNTALSFVAEKLGPQGGQATLDFLMNVFGNSAENVGGAIATGAMSVGGKAAEEKVGWGVKVTPDMWTNAIDNVGLGNTKFGQWAKDKINGIENSPVTDEEVQTELENNPELAEQLADAIAEVKQKVEADKKTETPTETPAETKEETKEPESTPVSEDAPVEEVKATIDAVDTEDVVSEVEKEVGSDKSDHVRETINRAIDRLKEADNLQQWWAEASSMVKRVKQAISDGDNEEAMKWYWRVADRIIPGYSSIAAGTTIAAVLLERLLGLTPIDVANNHGSREGESLYETNSPTDLSTRRDSKFIGGQNQTNEWNKGIQKEVYSDEQVKGFVRTMVRGQPHVRNLANKFRK